MYLKLDLLLYQNTVLTPWLLRPTFPNMWLYLFWWANPNSFAAATSVLYSKQQNGFKTKLYANWATSEDTIMPLCWWLQKQLLIAAFHRCLGYAWKVSLKCLTWVLMLHLIPKFSVWENEHNSISVNIHRKIMSLLYATVRWNNDDIQQTGHGVLRYRKKLYLPLGTLDSPRSMALAWPSIHLLSGRSLSSQSESA